MCFICPKKYLLTFLPFERVFYHSSANLFKISIGFLYSLEAFGESSILLSREFDFKHVELIIILLLNNEQGDLINGCLFLLVTLIDRSGGL